MPGRSEDRADSANREAFAGLGANGAVELNDLVDRTGKRRQNALEHAAHRAEDVGEADAALEEGLDGDFIGGVEDDGRAVVGGTAWRAKATTA